MSDSTHQIGCAGYQGRSALEKLQQESKNLILLKLIAPHCPACETLAPVLEQLVVDHMGDLDLVSIDMTEDPEFAMELGVRSAPTVVLFRGTKVLERIAGLKPKKFYADVVQNVLAA